MNSKDLANMRDDSILDKRRFMPRASVPSWYGEKAADDPLKEPWAKMDCPQCGRYCVVDYFHVEWHGDSASGEMKKIGNGHLLKNDDLTFTNIMRACRNGAYYWWEKKLSKLLPEHQHGYLNECIILKVKSTFPDPEGKYEGYKYSLEEYRRLLAEQEEEQEEEDPWNENEWIPDPNIPIQEGTSSSSEDENDICLEWNLDI